MTADKGKQGGREGKGKTNRDKSEMIKRVLGKGTGNRERVDSKRMKVGKGKPGGRDDAEGETKWKAEMRAAG